MLADARLQSNIANAAAQQSRIFDTFTCRSLSCNPARCCQGRMLSVLPAHAFRPKDIQTKGAHRMRARQSREVQHRARREVQRLDFQGHTHAGQQRRRAHAVQVERPAARALTGARLPAQLRGQRCAAARRIPAVQARAARLGAALRGAARRGQARQLVRRAGCRAAARAAVLAPLRLLGGDTDAVVSNKIENVPPSAIYLTAYPTPEHAT